MPPDLVRHAAFHVVAAILALALFAIAFGVAVMYLLQEREVKGKRFGALFSRLPSLDALDQLNQRLVRAGFAVFTVALLAGTLNASVVWKSAWSWDPQQITSRPDLAALRGDGAAPPAGLARPPLRDPHPGRASWCWPGPWGPCGVFPGATRHAGSYGSGTGAGGAQ